MHLQNSALTSYVVAHHFTLNMVKCIILYLNNSIPDVCVACTITFKSVGTNAPNTH